LAQHNRHLGVAAAGAVKANFTACPREAGVVLLLNVVQPQARSDRSGMVQILGFSGNSTDRPHGSTVAILDVVGPIAGSGTLEAVKAQNV